MSVTLKKKKHNQCVDEECTQPFSKTRLRSLRLWILVLQILTHSVYKSWNCKFSILIFISSAAAKILVDTKRFWIFDLMAFKFNPWKACSSTHNAWKLPNDVWLVDSFMLTSAVCHLFGFSIWSLFQICLFSDSKFLSILASHIQMFHNWTIECQISGGQHSAASCNFFLSIPGSWYFYEFVILALLVFHSSFGKHVLAICVYLFNINFKDPLNFTLIWINL